MRFFVIPNSGRVPTEALNTAYLWTDNWNDWFQYSTLYVLTYFDTKGKRYDIGGIKIGQFNWKDAQNRPELPLEFDELDDRFFSLGQDPDYYISLASLEEGERIALANGLRDVVFFSDLYERALNEKVMGTSLMRYIDQATIERQYRRILEGGEVLTEFKFHYKGAQTTDNTRGALSMDFSVQPNSRPPSNIQVLIGRNGVGKTHLLNSMTRAILSPNEDIKQDGVFTAQGDLGSSEIEMPFTNLVSVSFSAFDDFDLKRQIRDATKGMRYTQIGLKKRVKNQKDEWMTITRNPDELASEFSSSAKNCIRGARAKRWINALKTLEADPLFEEASVSGLSDLDEDKFGREAPRLYRRLSSGHKIVLLTITKLVETVQEKTLVLMDEPEAHLHPPLLSAFIRALSDLLVNRNGVALIATHSPVVLQEVPASCAWKLYRHGEVSWAERPKLETFAENVGSLTREVFGFEVTRSGFHRMLLIEAEKVDNFNDAIEKFQGEIGSEGRALISAMLATREQKEE